MTRRRSVKIGGGMHYRKLGRTGLMVSEVGFGVRAPAGDGGAPVDEDEALAAVARARALGVNLFDTADVYGAGRAERLLGRALSGDRASAVIAVRGGLRWDGGRPRADFDPAYLREAVERSRERLDTAWIDVYLLHNPAPADLANPALWEMLGALRADGVIRHVGVAARTPDDAAAAIRHDHVEVVQAGYNLLDPRAARVFPLAQERGTGIAVRAPLAAGLLNGRFTSEQDVPEGDRRRSWPRDRLRDAVSRAERFRFLASEGGPTLPQAALAWALSHPAVATAITAMRTPAHAEENAAAPEHAPLPEAVLSRVRALHGGGAP